MNIALPRSRVTSPQGANWGLWRFVIVLPLITVLAYPISNFGSVLLAIASLLVVPLLLKEAISTSWTKKSYARTPGMLIADGGVTFYGDSGPKHYDWSHFAEVFISTLDGKPIIQHLAIEDLELQNYARYSSYILTPVDHVLAEPDEILRAIKSHPNNPINNIDLRYSDA